MKIVFLCRFKSDPFKEHGSRSALAKAAQANVQLKTAMGKIGVDGKLESGDGSEAANEQFPMLPEPSPAPGTKMLQMV